MKGGKSIDSKPIFIIKAKENTIDILSLDPETRRKTLNSEGILESSYLVSIFNKLLDNLSKSNEIKRLLSTNNNETINYLMKKNWIIPIIDDYYLVGDEKDCPDIKLQSIQQFQKKIHNQYEINILTNAMKPYENKENKDITITSSISRMGIRNALLKTTDYDRSVLENEIIALEGFLIDFQKVFKEDLLMETSSDIIMKLYSPEIPYKTMNTLIKPKGNDFVEKTIEIFNVINVIENFYENNGSFNYTLEQAEKQYNYPTIKEFIPDNLIKERETMFKIFLPKELEKIYGIYNRFDTLSDTAIGRQIFLNKQYGGLPYYLYLNNDKTQLNQLIDKSVYRSVIYQFNEYLKEIATKIKMKLRLYRMVIQLQLSKKRLDEINKQMIKKNADITEYLTDKELEIINKYINKLEKNKKDIEKSKCPHFEIRKKYDFTVVIEDKLNYFSDLLKNFIDKPDKETQFIFCTNCGFNLGCNHEIILNQLLATNDEYKKSNLEEKLEKEYYVKDGTIYKCKYCGRKTKDAENEEQIEFDENGYLVKGNKIDNIDDNYLKLQELAKNVVIGLGIQNKENPFKLTDIVYPFLEQAYKSIESKELKTDEMKMQKELYMYIELYAVILSKLVKKKYKLWNQDPTIFEKSENIDVAGKFILEIFKVIKTRNSKFYNFLVANAVKSKFVAGIKRSYKKILSDDDVIDKSRFRLIVKKYNDDLTKLFSLAKDKDPFVKNYINKNPNEVINYLNNIFRYRLYLIKNDKPIDISRNKTLNNLLEKVALQGVPRFTNMIYYPSNPLKPLTPIGQYFMYNEATYNKDGSEIEWNTVRLCKNKKDIDINEKKLKKELKLMKENYNLNYSITSEEYDLPNGVNAITINEFKKDKINGKLVKSKLSKKGNRELYEKVIEYNEMQNAEEILKQWCGEEKTIEFKEHTFSCNPNKSELKTVIKLLEKRQIKGKLEKNKEIEFPDMPSGLNNKIDYSKLEKIKKELKINPEVITKYGKTPFEVLEYETKIKKMFKDKELEIKMKKFTKSKFINRINIIINTIIELQKHYQILHHGELTKCYKSPSLNYLCEFINDRDKNDFKSVLPREKYSITKYNDIKYTKKINYEEKINILLNIFIDLILFIAKTKLSIKYTSLFIEKMNKTALLLDVSTELFNKIESDLELQARKNFEQYLKMTPEEKLVKNFGNVALEQQIEILQEEVEKEEIMNEKVEYNQEYDQTFNDMSLDEEINQNDDAQFFSETIWEDEED